jgi:protein TonB
MKLASSFFVSVTLHALALASPISFSQPKPHDFIQVRILSVEDNSSGASPDGGSNGTSGHAPAVKSPAQSFSVDRHPAAPSRSPHSDPTPQSPSVTSPPDPSQSSIGAVTLLPSIAAETRVETSSDESAARYDGIGANHGRVSSGANGSAEIGIGAGHGSKGEGTVESLSQARYRETPKPNYPENARRKGREGTVLLRVLVDDKGHAKSVEINKSSGDDTLDRAAREAIERWRFIPAHYGEKAVESWIRIPVDFRLADSNSR